jgi:hypothetical protein
MRCRQIAPPRARRAIRKLGSGLAITHATLHDLTPVPCIARPDPGLLQDLTPVPIDPGPSPNVYETIELVVTVKAYPAISEKYGEVVRVAGIRRDLELPEQAACDEKPYPRPLQHC